MLFSLLCLSALLPFLQAYPDGAPPQVCESMQPNRQAHGNADPQSTASPYSIALSSATLDSDGSATVTVTISGNNFRGVLLKAGDAGGVFSEIPTGFRELANCGVTHADRNDKPQLVVKWRPSTGYSGNVTFVATVVQNKTTYWLNVTSAALAVTNPSGTAPTTAMSSTTSGASSAYNAAAILTASAVGMCLINTL